MGEFCSVGLQSPGKPGRGHTAEAVLLLPQTQSLEDSTALSALWLPHLIKLRVPLS